MRAVVVCMCMCVSLAVRASVAQVAGLSGSPGPASQREARQESADVELVQVSAAVVDRKGRPITGLRREDFMVREDGKPVELATFFEHKQTPGDPDSNRTLVLLLDDAGVAPLGTEAIQNIANAFVDVADRADDVVVVRLHARNDEPYGDRIEAKARIKAYRAGAWPLASWTSGEELLTRVADISKQVAGNASPRKTLVCIGSAFVCNIGEPQNSASRSYESAWLSAMAETTRADLSVYGLIPMRVSYRGRGLAETTGGVVLTPTSDLAPAIEQILAESSSYYVLGYWPVSERKTPHRIEVKVTTKGARVHARTAR